MAKPSPPKVDTHLIHEVEQSTNRHRLVQVRNGIPTRTAWFEGRQVGEGFGYHFHIGAAPGLPTVFRATPISHEELV